MEVDKTLGKQKKKLPSNINDFRIIFNLSDDKTGYSWESMKFQVSFIAQVFNMGIKV